MGQNFLAADREQGFLLPPDVRDWLPEGHFAWFVIEAVAQMDLTAIGRFRQRHQDALAGLFREVLALCADAGLVCAEVLAVDGTKLHANASERATCDYERLAREVLADAEAIDAEEDERFGEERGDELPEPLGTRQGRAKWLADAKRRLEERRAHEARPIPASRPARLREAKRRLEEEHRVEVRANAGYEAYRARGVNRTDPDSRNVKTLRGWAQGYNAQAVSTDRQIVVAAELTNSSADFGQLGPLVDAARRELRAAGIERPPDVVLADAGYWHQ